MTWRYNVLMLCSIKFIKLWQPQDLQKFIISCHFEKKRDNTNWRAGRAGGPCFQMEKVNFRRAGGLLHTRQKGRLHKKAVRRAAEKGGADCRKGQPSGPSFSAAQLNVQTALMYSPLAHPVVQPAGPSFCAARQPAENSCFLFGNTALQPARPSV